MTAESNQTTATTITNIPLNLLVPSPENARRTGRNVGIRELAASIGAHKLRQCLNVKANGAGKYEVVAGERRRLALRLLAKAKQIAKDFPVPCVLLEEGEEPREISLVENEVRVAMHPADQFETFRALVHDKGYSIEKVAERFGVETSLVEKRLKLAAVAPRLFEAYRKGEMALDVLMAFTVTDDHAAQLRLWKERGRMYLNPHTVRRALTEGSMPISHKLVRFVGVDAYVAAGGVVMRDLFDEENEGYCANAALVMELAGSKMEAVEQEVVAEGWKWAKGEFEYDYATQYRRIHPLAASAGIEADVEDGESEADEGELSDEYSDGDGEEETEEEESVTFAAEDMARAGVRIRIDSAGGVSFERGLVRREDWEPEEDAVRPAKAKPDAAKGEYAATLVEDLTAHKTAALRLELSRNPVVALAATVHALALPLLYRTSYDVQSALELRGSSADVALRVKERDDCSAHAAMDAATEAWMARLPEDAGDLFGWCLAQPQETLLDLLAFVAALSVNIVRDKQMRAESPRLVHGDALAAAVALDMTQHWNGSEAGFYSRLPKAGLIHAVADAKAEMSVSISALKKDEAARCACKAMSGTGWLPQPLRAAPAAQAALAG